MKCPDCGFGNPSTERLCRSCGAELTPTKGDPEQHWRDKERQAEERKLLDIDYEAKRYHLEMRRSDESVYQYAARIDRQKTRAVLAELEARK